MDSNIFINLALDTSIRKYISIKENNNYDGIDFLLYVISLLIFIYGEDNILDLYEKHDENSFNYLLCKYNMDMSDIKKFYNDLNEYYNMEIRKKALNKRKKNEFYIYVQEDLVDMFVAKYEELKFDSKRIEEFKNMLFSKNNESKQVRDYNSKMCDDPNYILDYFNAKINNAINPLEFTLERTNVLSNEVYERFGLTSNKIDKLSYSQLDSINNQIYNKF